MIACGLQHRRTASDVVNGAGHPTTLFDATMPYAITLGFDAAAEAQIKAIWRANRMLGFPQRPMDDTQPHLTLAMFEDLDLPVLAPLLHTFARDQAALRINFESVAHFPGSEGVVFAAAVMTRALMDLHRRMFMLVQPHASGCKAFYVPDQWVPHCTLAMWTIGNGINQSLEVARGFDWPLPATLRLLGVQLIGAHPPCSLLALPLLGKTA